MNRLIVSAAAVVFSILTVSTSACYDPVPPPVVEKKGSISGAIEFDVSGTSAGVVARGLHEGGLSVTSRARPATWMAGRGIVLLARAHQRKAFDRDVVLPTLKRTLAAAGLDKVEIRTEYCMMRKACSFRMTEGGAVPSMERTQQIIVAMHKSLDKAGPIVLVSRDMIAHGHAVVPNDPDFSLQWHYSVLGMTAAWEISIGDPELVVASLDSGVVTGHPDLQEKLARDPASQNNFVMADFVSPELSGDGDGDDLNAEDPGDGPDLESTTFHGTHTSGTMLAETNNGQGVAGILWNAQLVPVRVLGRGLSGSSVDILRGLLWSVGDPDTESELTANVRPAKIVNLSLGGPTSEADAIWEEFTNAILDNEDDKFPQRPILVCSAGNDAARAEGVIPAKLDRMITVGASKINNSRAEYSNFGPPVDIMAPGGEGGTDENADGQADAVFSTWNTSYKLEFGTSQAAPHVSGVIGLILDVAKKQNRTLNHDQVRTLITDTADTRYTCTEGCGSGLLDPVRALLAAGAEIPQTPRLEVVAPELFFRTGVQLVETRILNLGNVALPYTITLSGAQASLFSVQPSTGVVLPSGAAAVEVTLARGAATVGDALLTISGTGEAASQSATISLRFDDDNYQPRLTQNIEVQLFERSKDGLVERQTVVATAANDFAFSFADLPSGLYEVHAVGDDDKNGVYDPLLESVGVYPEFTSPLEEKAITLAAGDARNDIRFSVRVRPVDPAIRNGGVGAPCEDATQDDDCSVVPAATRNCITSFERGYCTMECDANNLCPQGAVCAQLQCGDEPCNLCLQTCSSDFQCRNTENYRCDDCGTCVPAGLLSVP
jgi:serine protease